MHQMPDHTFADSNYMRQQVQESAWTLAYTCNDACMLLGRPRLLWLLLSMRNHTACTAVTAPCPQTSDGWLKESMCCAQKGSRAAHQCCIATQL